MKKKIPENLGSLKQKVKFDTRVRQVYCQFVTDTFNFVENHRHGWLSKVRIPRQNIVNNKISQDKKKVQHIRQMIANRVYLNTIFTSDNINSSTSFTNRLHPFCIFVIIHYSGTTLCSEIATS